MRKTIATFIITQLIFVLLLMISGYVPREVIRPHMESSADLLCSRPVFFTLADEIEGSRVDRYADSILLNIALNLDGSIKQSMMCSYYNVPTQNENENLREGIDKAPNQQYLRYWHGSAAFVRLFHAFGDIRGMYVVNGIMMAALILILLILLWKENFQAAAISLLLALIIGSIWIVPFSLEYTWTVLIALAFSIIVLIRKDRSDLIQLFMLSGMITAYLDFLTTETLTLLMPLMLLTAVTKRPVNIRRTVKLFVSWSLGYVLTWISKWILAAIVLQQNVLSLITEHVGERVSGDIGLSMGKYLLGAVIRNIRCLFPLEYGGAGIFGALVIIVAVAYRLFVYFSPGADRRYMLMILTLSLIPFARFIVLRNHSYLHSFFTFRALIATVFGIGLMIAELTDKGK